MLIQDFVIILLSVGLIVAVWDREKLLDRNEELEENFEKEVTSSYKKGYMDGLNRKVE